MAEHASGRKIGIIGGSFDPVHVGHLIIAQDAFEHLELSEVVFMPAGIPPHKQHVMLAESRHRLNMLSLCLESDVRFRISDAEIQRKGISYTYNTVCDFLDSEPDAEVVLIVGSDTLVDLHNWYNIEGILQHCDVASFLRPGEHDLEQIMEKVNLPDPLKEKLVNNVFSSHLVDISSSDIRMRVAEGLGIRYLVPGEVEMYIYEHGLYRG